jgi:uncharacterized protein YbaR (Trm112 family)
MSSSSDSILDPVLDALACPQCGGALQWRAEESADEGDGTLGCVACNALTPVLSGIIFFGETKAALLDRRTVLTELRARIGMRDDYARYAEEKAGRNVLEPYAAFAPFNESTRAALPLLYRARDHLDTNDLILDLSNRSGWTGAFLAGLFPEQRVIAFWEGDNSVLGYRGFLHWFGTGRKPSNLFPVFLPPGMPFPLRAGAARLVHGYDILHHRSLPEFLVEALRVAAADAVLVFPHIHLSNGEPVPWFARGGTHRHGRDYQALLAQYLPGDMRRPAVLSELSAFDAWMADTDIDQAFAPDPETTHYNGVIAVAPPSIFKTPASARRAALSPSVLFVSNPFLRVNALTGRVHLLEDALSGHLRHMFDRHPAYESFLLRAIDGLVLSSGECEIIAAMEEGAELSRLAFLRGLPVREAEQHVSRLVAADLVVPVPVAQHVWRLQQAFHANGHSLLDREPARLLREWIGEAPQASAFALMGVDLTRAEVGEISAALLQYLAHARPLGNTLRVVGADARINAWLGLLTAVADWNMGENANLVFTLVEGDLSVNKDGRTISLVEIVEAYGGVHPEPAGFSPSFGRLEGRDILRIAAALA